MGCCIQISFNDMNENEYKLLCQKELEYKKKNIKRLNNNSNNKSIQKITLLVNTQMVNFSDYNFFKFMTEILLDNLDNSYYLTYIDIAEMITTKFKIPCYPLSIDDENKFQIDAIELFTIKLISRKKWNENKIAKRTNNSVIVYLLKNKKNCFVVAEQKKYIEPDIKKTTYFSISSNE